MVKTPKKEPNEPTDAQAEKLRDDALRRALQTPPQHKVKPKDKKAKKKPL